MGTNGCIDDCRVMNRAFRARVDRGEDVDSTEGLVAIGHRAMSPLRAIRAKCYECVLSAYEINTCSSPSCPLWPFRSGHNPWTEKREGNTEALNRYRESLSADKEAHSV